jgi:hypothetical protein
VRTYEETQGRWPEENCPSKAYAVRRLGTGVVTYAGKVKKLLRVKPYKMKRSAETCSQKTAMRIINADNDCDNNDSTQRNRQNSLRSGNSRMT